MSQYYLGRGKNMPNKKNSQWKSHKVWALVIMVAIALNACGSTQNTKVYKVGILSGLTVFASTTDGIKAKMTELGYVEGTNIIYDVRTTNSDPVAEKASLEKFVADKVDLVVAFPSEQAVLAKEVLDGTNIPLVFCQTNIEGTDLVKNVREPGGNITGVRYPGPDIAVRRFEILLALAPQAKRIWVPYLKTSPIVNPQLEVLRPAAAAAGVTLIEVPADSAADLAADLATRTGEDVGIDAILFIAEPLVRTAATFPMVAKFAVEHKLPMGGTYISIDGYTTLFGVATDNIAVGKLVAQQIDKIFKGIPPGTIPVVSAESYLTIDYKAAQGFGLTVPEGLLKQANQIIR
jgi:putative tryptophan/tyrosine transport system substrate-binding protein